jgi:chromosome segregation ATPase
MKREAAALQGLQQKLDTANSDLSAIREQLRSKTESETQVKAELEQAKREAQAKIAGLTAEITRLQNPVAHKSAPSSASALSSASAPVPAPAQSSAPASKSVPVVNAATAPVPAQPAGPSQAQLDEIDKLDERYQAAMLKTVATKEAYNKIAGIQKENEKELPIKQKAVEDATTALQEAKDKATTEAKAAATPQNPTKAQLKTANENNKVQELNDKLIKAQGELKTVNSVVTTNPQNVAAREREHKAAIKKEEEALVALNAAKKDAGVQGGGSLSNLLKLNGSYSNSGLHNLSKLLY